jgi:hypothetical protein
MLVTADELREIVKAAIGSLLVRAERGEGPPWWCEVCDSWRFTKNCGRDECPAPAPTLTNGHERSCQTQQKGAYPHCTCAPCAQRRTWGVIEIAVRNPNVSSYMEHWEGRALKAEAELARLSQQR